MATNENTITPEQLKTLVQHKMNTASERAAYLEPWIDAIKEAWPLIGVRYAISINGGSLRTGIKLDSNETKDLWLDANGKFYELDKNTKLPSMSGGHDISNDKAVTDYDVISCKNSLINAVLKLPDNCPQLDPAMLKALHDLVKTKLSQ